MSRDSGSDITELAAIVEQISVGLILVRQDGTIGLWNRWMENFSRRKAITMVGQRLDDLFAERLNPALTEAINGAQKHGRSRLLTYAIHGKILRCGADDERNNAAINVSVVPLPAVDGGRNCLLQLVDVTASVKREEQLQQQVFQNLRSSLVDQLTGILNRRAFDHWLGAEIRRSTQAGEPLTCLMVDIDHFKAFNDAGGHSAGDQCLRQIAAILQSRIVRPGDAAFRYGGEEFAVLLTTTDRRGAQIVAKALIDAVRDSQIPHPAMPGSVTISIGTASIVPAAVNDGERLVELADAALYNAKRAGRDTCCCAEGSVVVEMDMANAGRKVRITDRQFLTVSG